MTCKVCDGKGDWPEAGVSCPLCDRECRIEIPDAEYEFCPYCQTVGLKNEEICPVCHGIGYRYPGIQQEVLDRLPGRSSAEAPIFFIEAGTHHTASQTLDGLVSDLSGELRIYDPYYGDRTLKHLELLKHCGPIRFLTERKGGGQSATLATQFSDFLNEYPQFEFRKNSGSGVHDRFILSNEALIILGHGLVSLGGKKDSFIIRLPVDAMPDMTNQVRDRFDTLWSAAGQL